MGFQVKNEAYQVKSRVHQQYRSHLRGGGSALEGHQGEDSAPARCEGDGAEPGELGAVAAGRGRSDYGLEAAAGSEPRDGVKLGNGTQLP